MRYRSSLEKQALLECGPLAQDSIESYCDARVRIVPLVEVDILSTTSSGGVGVT